MSRTGRLLCIVAACALLASGSAWSNDLPPGFRLEPVLGGLTNPSALDRTPDGRILIAERTTGQVRVVDNGTLQTSPLCNVSVNSSGEGGLLGLAVHPDFGDNGWLYLYYTSGSTNVNKVTRVTLSGNSCAGETDIVADLGAGANFERNGGGLAFGPDGTLYVTVGDMENSAAAQDDGLLQGKVLRMNDDGTPLPGGLVFAKGIRDGRDVAFKGDGSALMVDHGDQPTAVADELNPVPEGGNLGWDVTTGDVIPLVSWLDPTIGIESVLVYAASAFPDMTSDGLDNDHDKFGPNGFPGLIRKDDNGTGQCIGGTGNSGPCTITADCGTRPSETEECYYIDEMDEYCPGGVPFSDDACGSTGAGGIDEPDEGYDQSLFMASGNQIARYVEAIAAPDDKWSTFLDSTSVADCPTGWTDAMEGADGFLYATATNGGGAAGGLYRVIYDGQAGPREVSAPGSHFPLLLGKGTSPNEVVLYWEDLRNDSSQPRNNARPAREYALWEGDIGTWYSHAPVPGFEGMAGTAVNDAMRSQVRTTTSDAVYFLISGRADNIQGPLGTGTAARPGYAVTDICDTIGYYEDSTWNLWSCGQDFTLEDEFGETRSLSEFRGQPIMMDLSAVWCVPCQGEANILENLYQDYKDRGVMVLTVLMDDETTSGDWEGRPNPPECRKWGNRAEAFPDHTFPCFSDPRLPSPQQAWPRYRESGSVPRNVILDSGMRVVYFTGGYPESTIRARLDELVGTAPSCLD